MSAPKFPSRPLGSLAALGLLAALCLGTTACSDEASTSTTPSTTAQPTTEAPSDSTSPAVTDPAVTDPAVTDHVHLDVAIGVDSGEDHVEHVTFGAEVTLTIINGPDAAEYHVHGIDLEVAAEAGQTVTLDFVASVAGPYEVEDHETGAVILVIEVDQ